MRMREQERLCENVGLEERVLPIATEDAQN